MGGPQVGRRVHEAERALGRLQAVISSSATGFALTRILERQEAVSSSAIEGTHGTLDALLELEESEEGTPEAHETRGVTFALGRGLQAVRDLSHDAFTPDMVCQMHQALAERISAFNGLPGAVRDEVVWIGGIPQSPAHSTWNPPPPREVMSCLNDSLSYLRDAPVDPSQFSPIVRAAVSHAHFEAVHPFRDGNGRVGRLLMSLLFAAEGLPPLYTSAWIETYKSDYYEALRAAQQQLDYGPMIDVIARAILGTEAEFQKTVAAIETLQATWQEDCGLRKGSTALRTLHYLAAYPVLRARTLEGLLEVSFKSASTGLAKLVEVGILQEKTGYARNRIFVAPDILSVLNRQFGSDPEDALAANREHPRP